MRYKKLLFSNKEKSAKSKRGTASRKGCKIFTCQSTNELSSPIAKYYKRGEGKYLNNFFSLTFSINFIIMTKKNNARKLAESNNNATQEGNGIPTSNPVEVLDREVSAPGK